MGSLNLGVTGTNNYNSEYRIYQGGYGTGVKKGGTVTSRKGYLDITGISALRGKTITKITFYARYNGGKSAEKTIKTSSPSYSFVTNGSAYGGVYRTNEFTSGALFNDIVNKAAAGTDTSRWTFYNGETTTTHSANGGADSYTENYMYIDALTLTVHYQDSYTVSFIDNTGNNTLEGSLPSSSTVNPGASYTVPSANIKQVTETGSYTVSFNRNYNSTDTTSGATAKTASYKKYQEFANTYHYKLTGDTSWRDAAVGSTITVNQNLSLQPAWHASIKTSVNSITAPTAPTRTGYTFKGWGTSRTSTSGVTFPYTPSDNVTLYAIWQVNTYTVSYNANGGSGAPSAQTKTHGVTLKLSTTKPTKASSSSDSTSTITITYNANGGSSAPSASTGTKTVTTTTPYTFSTWNTSSNGSGTSYASGANYTANAAATLYAQYTAGTATTSTSNPSILMKSGISRSNASAGSYTVTFNANGGSCSTTSLAAARTTSYSFGGWNTNSSGTGTNYVAGAYYTFSASDTLYAKWDSTTSTAAITLPTATRTNYEFKGWSTSSTATSGTTGSYTPTGNVTLYAVWKQTEFTYTINFNGNSNTGGSLPSTITKTGTDSSVVMGDFVNGTNVPTRTGYVFRGWSSTTSYNTKRIAYASTYGGSADYNGSGAVTTSSSWTYANYCSYTNYTGTSRTLTLYAQWEKEQYTISYNANGGTNAPSAQTKIYGTALTLSSTKPSHSNTTANGYLVTFKLNAGDTTTNHTTTYQIVTTSYTFNKWNTAANGSGTDYSSGASYTANAAATLYAQWSSSDSRGSVAKPTDPTRTGYTFQGWATTSSATSSNVTFPYTPTANKTLYAVWKANTWTVSYNGNAQGGGTVSNLPSSQTKTYGVALTLSSTKPTHSTVTNNTYTVYFKKNAGDTTTNHTTSYAYKTTSYTFKNWNLNSSGTSTSYSSGGSYTSNSAATMYAQWNSSTANATVSAPSTNPTRTGYNFLGWGSSSTASSNVTFPYTITANTSLYARWQLKTYTVSFSANGGSGAPSAQTKTHGVNLTLSTTVPTRDGYNFLGWSTSSTATSATYGAGGSYTTDASTTLYAVWQLKTYTVSYSLNNGKGTIPASQTKTHGVTLTLQSTSGISAKDNTTQNGYKITLDANGGTVSPTSVQVIDTVKYSVNGWNTNSSGTGTSYTSGGSYTTNASATMYVKWSSSVTKGTATLPTPTREGYTFNGWYTASTGGTKRTSGYTPTSSETLYAQWTIKTYAISYYINGGTSSTLPDNQTKTHGVDITLSSTKPSRATINNATYTVKLNYNGQGTAESSSSCYKTTSYSFKNWNTNSAGTGTSYNSGATYSTNAALNLYAQWNSSTSTTSITLPTPTWTGKNFKGWSTSSNATTGSYSGGTSYTPTANVTLYAIWELKTYTISYNANGGSGAPSAQTKTHGTALTLSSTKPTKGNSTNTITTTLNYNGNGTSNESKSTTETRTYSFYRWYGTINNTTKYFDSGASYTDEQSVTLYAQYSYSSSYTTFTLPTPTRNGYRFDGWYSAASGGTKIGSGGASYKPTSNSTIYAHWTQGYTVSYDANGGTGAPANQTKYHGENLTLSSTKPTKSNTVSTISTTYVFLDGITPDTLTQTRKTIKYPFVDWSATVNNTAVHYQAGGIYSENATIALKANYSSSTTYGNFVTLLPTRPEYSFVGWYNAETGGTKVVDGDTTYTPTSNTTLYARWEKKPCSIATLKRYKSSTAQEAVKVWYKTPSEMIPIKTVWRYTGSQWQKVSQDGEVDYDKNWVPRSISSNGLIFNTTGYQDGYRLNSNGTTTALSSSTISGFIPCTPKDVIRLAGVNWIPTVSSAYSYIVFYDENFATLATLNCYTNDSAGVSNINGGTVLDTTKTNHSITANSNGVFTFNLKYLNNASFAYIRISAEGQGKNMIITINKEME